MSLSKLRVVAPLALAVAGFAFTPACSAVKDAEQQGDCGATAEGTAFLNANTSFVAAVNSIQFTVATACFDIANKGGMASAVMWDGATGGDGKSAASASNPPTTDQLQSACDAAATVIGNLQAMGSWSLTVTGGECHADISAQASCTAMCSGDASCSGGDISAECDPGEISGQCSGTCNVGATCDGNANVQVDCSGSCSGSCSGTVTGGCDANCMGTCMGTCQTPSASASCSGKCSGSCKVTQPNFMCTGGASCTGGCSVTVTAPSCKGVVKPPMCNASASCQGSCQASAQASASCTPPSVEIVSSGSIDASLLTAIQADLGQIFLVAKVQGANLVTLSGQVVGGIKAAVSGSAACALELQGFVQAQANISVSVSASASVSGKASAGS